MKRAASALILAFGMATLGGDCEGDIVQDPTFRDWCGSSLCAWHIDGGTIVPAPTWNQNDLGVSFLDQGTQISQVTTEASAQCITFTSVADLDPLADMTLAVDFDSDGSFEYSAPLASAQWQKVETEITAPAAYQGITFVLKKGGTGTAVLAELRIQSSSGCTAAPVTIDAGVLQFGEKCSDSTECAAGLTCTGAQGDALCSQCSSSVACAGGAACTARSVFLPSQCGAGQGLGKTGDPCLTGSDCASAACDGVVTVPLGDEAGTCDLDASLGTSNPSNCEWYGARGGQCQ
jgi:hypothetical protein